mgnify:CR=1 FL=1
MKQKWLTLLSLIFFLCATACGSRQPTTPTARHTEGIATVENRVATPTPSAQVTQETPAATMPEQVYTSANMEYVGRIEGASLAVDIQEDILYLGIGQRLALLDISNPAMPLIIGKTQTFAGIVVDFVISGGLAYVADDEAGLRIVDVTDPTNPAFAGYYSIPRIALHDEVNSLKYDNVASVAVDQEHAYVAEYQFGLRVVNIADPSNPVEVGFYDTPGDAHGVAVAGDTAYVADFDHGVRVVNIADPARPVERGHCDTPGEAQSLAVAGDYVYVAGGSAGMLVVNIADPSHPVLVGSFHTHGYTQSLTIKDGYAYIADGSAGLVVVNIADPAHPQFAGAYDTPGYAWGAAIAEEYVYVADANYGLIILRFTGGAEQ